MNYNFGRDCTKSSRFSSISFYVGPPTLPRRGGSQWPLAIWEIKRFVPTGHSQIPQRETAHNVLANSSNFL